MSESNTKHLKFEEVKFNFIYDFVFSVESWNDLPSSFVEGIPKDRMGWIPSKISPTIIENQKYLWLDIDSVIKGEELTSTKDSIFKTALLSKDDCSVNIAILIRLKKTGLGTISIIVEKQDCITNYEDLNSFARLVPTTWNQIMKNTVSETLDENNYVTKVKNDEWDKDYTLQHIFFKTLKILNEQLGIVDIDSDNSKSIFGNLKPNSLAELISLETNDEFPHPKTIDPYVHFAGKLEKTFYNKLFLDSGEFNMSDNDFSESEYNNYVKQIIAILFRFFDLVNQHPYLSMDYIRKEFDFSNKTKYPRLISNNVNLKYFSYIHRMSSISLYYEDKGIPYEMIDKSLNDMLENARAKLRGLNHANFQLDELIEILNSQNEYSINKIKEILESLINIQKMLAYSLADLNVLLYDGQVAYDIIELIYDKLNVKQLNSSVFDKVALVKGLVNDYRSYERFSSLKNQ